MFKRNPSLAEQVKVHLKDRILKAEFQGGRIPPETDLAAELRVSRNTVRDALSRLEMEGFVSRRQGAGTFVNETVAMVKSRLEKVLPYETMIREHGFTPTVQLVGVEKEPADSETAACLNLSPAETLLVVKKLFLADEQPVIFHLTYLSPKLITQPYSSDDIRGPIYRFIPQFCQQEFAYYVSEIVPVRASNWLIDQLQLPTNHTMLLSFEEVGYNQDNQPIVKAYSYFRNDLLKLRLIRRPAS